MRVAAAPFTPQRSRRVAIQTLVLPARTEMNTAHLLSIVYATAIGLLIGVERERSHRGATRRAFGVRTFAVLAITGTLAAALSVWLVVVGMAAVAAMAVVEYLRTSHEDSGNTTEFAAIATFLLGSLCYREHALAAGVAIGVAVILASKARLHAFVRDVVTDREMEDALKFAVIAFVVLPLLPDHGVGPYRVLNPSHIWLIVVMLNAISWIGYISVRKLGPRRGLLATGLASGFVSASATTAAMGPIGRDADQLASAVAGAEIASVATLFQLEMMLLYVSPAIAGPVAAPLAAGALVLGLWSYLGYRRNDTVSDTQPEIGVTGGAEIGMQRRAFILFPAILLAAILTAALFVGRWGSVVFGSKGAVITAALTGLADAHAGALSVATLFSQGNLARNPTLEAVVAALVANSIVKAIMAFASGGVTFGRRFSLALAASTATVLGALALVMFLA